MVCLYMGKTVTITWATHLYIYRWYWVSTRGFRFVPACWSGYCSRFAIHQPAPTDGYTSLGDSDSCRPYARNHTYFDTGLYHPTGGQRCPCWLASCGGTESGIAISYGPWTAPTGPHPLPHPEYPGPYIGDSMPSIFGWNQPTEWRTLSGVCSRDQCDMSRHLRLTHTTHVCYWRYPVPSCPLWCTSELNGKDHIENIHNFREGRGYSFYECLRKFSLEWFGNQTFFAENITTGQALWTDIALARRSGQELHNAYTVTGSPDSHLFDAFSLQQSRSCSCVTTPCRLGNAWDQCHWHALSSILCARRFVIPLPHQMTWLHVIPRSRILHMLSYRSTFRWLPSSHPYGISRRPTGVCGSWRLGLLDRRSLPL